MTDPVKLLSDDALREIEARLKSWAAHEIPNTQYPASWSEVDALCATVRALRAENERLDNEPRLGCATTRQLLDEIRARIEIHHSLDYRTIDPTMKYDLHSTAVARGLSR